MHRFQSKTAFLSAILPALLVAQPIPGFAQTTPADCKALVQARNNLWFVKPDGTAVVQITNDAEFRTAAALHSSGTLIAYSGSLPSRSVTLIDASGGFLGSVDLGTEEPIVDLSWVTPTLLRAAEHAGPRTSRYHFLQLERDKSLKPVQAPGAAGGTCALAPNGKDTACTTGDAVVLNGRDIYYATDGFSFAPILLTTEIAVGTSIVTPTSPAFGIEVKSITGDAIVLKITTPDGLWQEQRVPAGSTMSVTYDDAGDRATYGFQPALGANARIVRLTLRKSVTGPSTFEGAITWDPRGKRIAVVESNALGQLTWVLLNRQMGQAATQGKGGIDAEEALPIDGPVASIDFTSDSHIRIEGLNQVFEKDIPAQGKVPTGTAYTVTPVLPRQLEVTLEGKQTIADVKGWICR